MTPRAARRALLTSILRVGMLALPMLAMPVPAGAQRADSARTAVSAGIDTSTRPVVQPPISPRRAFLYSLALPGYAQSRLGRPAASAIFVTAEVIGIAMLRESNAALRQAKRLRTDSLVVIGYTPNGDGSQTPITARSPYTQELVDLRRGHREDWVAALIANHFFAGADAYVAAHLWDLPSQVSIRRTPGGTTIAARLRW